MSWNALCLLSQQGWGGLGIDIPSKTADRELQSSILVTSTLQDHILSQEDEYGHDIITEQLASKATIRNSNKERVLKDANDLMGILPDGLQRAVTLAKEKGSSSWLTALPLAEHSFTLHKGAFHDALALRYGWTPSNLPANCGCGSSFSVEHALTCAKGGFVHCRHNEIRDLTATLLTEVCKDVRVEPELQPVTHEVLNGATANSQDGARLDIAANGVWGGNFERTYFDVRVFNPHAPTNRHTALILLQKARAGKDAGIRAESARSGACHLYPPSDGSNRRSGQRGQRFLQKISLHAHHQMGSLLQHYPMLATLSPCFLPATFLHPSHQRC